MKQINVSARPAYTYINRRFGATIHPEMSETEMVRPIKQEDRFMFFRRLPLSMLAGLSVIALLAGSACKPVRLVYSEGSSTVRLSRTDVKTFGFAELVDRVKVNRANGEKIKEYVQHAVVRELQAMGYQYAEEDPDLLVDLHTNIRSFQQDERSRYNNASPYGPYGYRYRYRYGYYGYDPYGWQMSDLETNASMQAEITLVFAEAGQDQALWTGTAEAKLSSNPEKSVSRLNEAVEKLLERPGS